jgi:quinoprotein glucose dehydrogenase
VAADRFDLADAAADLAEATAKAIDKDEKIRAFATKTGEVLWAADLPAGGYATPATYSVNGRQYVVIACGGGKLRTKSGDAYVAFALPE